MFRTFEQLQIASYTGLFNARFEFLGSLHRDKPVPRPEQDQHRRKLCADVMPRRYFRLRFPPGHARSRTGRY